MTLTKESKKQIDLLTLEELRTEVLMGKKSRFQGDKADYVLVRFGQLQEEKSDAQRAEDTTLELEKASIAKEANEISKEANKYSKIAIAISILALIITLFFSAKSCQISNDALMLQKKLSQEAALTNFIGSYSKVEDVLSIKATNPEVNIQRIKIYYPSTISDQTWDVEQPEFKHYMTLPIFKIKTLINDRFPRIDDKIQMVDNNSIPIVMESQYLVKGNTLFEKSLYIIEFEAIVWDSINREPSINIKGLSFIQRLPLETSPVPYLDRLWVQGDTK